MALVGCPDIAQPDMAEITRHRITHMQNVAQELQALAHSWVSAGSIPEVDWSKVKTLEFQDTLKSRQSFSTRLEGKICLTCPDFDEHVRQAQEPACSLP